MYTLKYDKKIKEFRHRDSCLVRKAWLLKNVSTM